MIALGSVGRAKSKAAEFVSLAPNDYSGAWVDRLRARSGMKLTALNGRMLSLSRLAADRKPRCLDRQAKIETCEECIGTLSAS